MQASAVISVLARSFLAGEPTIDGVHSRAIRTLGRSWRWLRPLAHRYLQAFSGRTRPRHRDVVRFLSEDAGFRRACTKYRWELDVAEWLAEPQRMQPVGAARGWDLPAIETVGDLARWLSLHRSELEWFADLRGLGSRLRNPKLQHYWYRIQSKRSGGVRLIESPKSKLKELQRWMVSAILNRIPAHQAAHGFVKGRSIVTFASPHLDKDVVLRLDLQDFFPAYPAAGARLLSNPRLPGAGRRLPGRHLYEHRST